MHRGYMTTSKLSGLLREKQKISTNTQCGAKTGCSKADFWKALNLCEQGELDLLNDYFGITFLFGKL